MHLSTHLGDRMNKHEFGKIIKERRSILNISQKDLAEISGVNLRKLVDIENAKANPTYNTIAKLLTAIGLEIQIRTIK